jgi:serine/threonine protein kinase/WD40 repeat protein
MAITTADKMIEDLRTFNLLSPSQLGELEALPERPSDSRALAKELVKREWLTRFQAAVLYQGRAKELFLGPYVLIDKLGAGGMGEVYRARHVRLERVVALKLIRTDRMKSQDAVSRFQREARAAASLSHPNVVTVWEDGQEGNVHFFAMEFVKGVDLSKWVREKGPMPVAHACHFIRQAALGLQHAHERGMVHRDIKPSNLMLVAGANQIKVLDMGLARLDRGDVEDSSSSSDAGSITQEGAVMGTPDFLSPEQAMNAHKVDIRADIYSLGCSLYFLLTGQPPFPGGALSEKLLKHHLEEPKPVRELRAETPEGLANVLAKMMAKKPEDRYQTPGEAAAALAPFCKAGASQVLRLPAGKQAASDADPATPTLAQDESIDVELITNLRQPAATTGSGGSSVNKGVRAKTPLQLAGRPALGILGWAFGAFMALVAVASGVVLLVVFLNFLGGDKHDDTTSPATNSVPARAINLDDLKIDATPTDERLGWLREEVVGVLGTHKWRHWAAVKGLAFKKDGSELASFGDDEMLRFCNARTGAERLQIPTSSPNQGTRDLTFSPDGKYLAAVVNGAVTVYWAETGREKTVTPLAGTAAAYSGDNKILALAAGPNVNLYSADGSNQLGTLKHAGLVTALAFQPRTNLLATITAPDPKRPGSTEIKIWDLTKEPNPAQPKVAFPVASHFSQTLLVSGDGGFVVSAATQPVAGKWPVYIWDVKTKNEKAQIPEAHRGNIWTTALSSDGKTLITGSFDGSVCIWNMQNLREPRFKLEEVGGPVHSVALAPDDRTLAVGGNDLAYRDPTFRGGVIHLYDVATGKEREESAKAFAEWIRAVTLTHDRTQFAVALQDKSIKLVDAARLQERTLLKGHSAPALALGFALDDRTLFSGSLDKTVALWDVSKGAERPPPLMGQFAVQALALSPDGSQLASGYLIGGTPPSATIKLWDPIGHKELATLLGHTSTVTALDYFHEGKRSRLLSGSKDGSVRVWDAANAAAAKELFTIPGAHPNGVSAVATSPWDVRKTFVSAGEDGMLKVWDATKPNAPVQTLKNALTLGAAPAPYRAAVFSPDGKLLAVGCQRGGLTLYDTGTWKEVRQWRWPGAIQQLAFDTSGKHLLSVNSNGSAYVLRLPLSR